MFFTYGLVVILALVIPMGFINLDDNISVQTVSFVLAIGIGSQWVISSILMGRSSPELPIFTQKTSNLAVTIGTIILNLGFSTVVPSWVNIKRNDISVQKVVWSAVVSGVLFYTIIGISCIIVGFLIL